jgi:hypothetical protein
MEIIYINPYYVLKFYILKRDKARKPSSIHPNLVVNMKVYFVHILVGGKLKKNRRNVRKLLDN